MSERRPNIAFAGLTAAGKTTHAKILAEQLGYEYVSATQIILDILDISDNPDQVWFTDYDEIEKAREGDRVDIELESRLQYLAETRDGLVLDTWAMAYIYNGPLIRIWMESDSPSRTRKCFVSQGEQKPLDISGCHDLITRKDKETREKFLKRLDFDLFEDMTKYDARICNTDLIPVATGASSEAGIAAFKPVVYDVATYLIDQVTGANQPSRLPELRLNYGPMIQQLNEQPWSY